MKFLKSNLNLVMICAGALGYVLILLLFFFDEFSGGSAIRFEGERSMFFNRNPAYLIWVGFMVMQGALWCLLIFPATSIILRIRKELGKEFNIIRTFLILFIAVLVMTAVGRVTIFNYLKEPTTFFNNNSFKVDTFTNLARGMGIYFLAGIVLVGKKCLRNIEINDFDIADYKRLRGYQDMLLNFTGLVLSLGAITSILYNKAVLIDNKGDLEKFPAEFVITFGLLNTLVMMIFYLPNYFIMLDYGKRIVERKFPIENENKILISENFANQDNMSKDLKIDLTVTESIKKALLILSPLLSSFLPKFFDLFGK